MILILFFQWKYAKVTLEPVWGTKELAIMHQEAKQHPIAGKEEP